MTAVQREERKNVTDDRSFWPKVDKTLRHFARRGAQAVRGLAWDFHPFLAERPIFVVGCSRAGTTLAYRTLSESRELGSLSSETHDYWSNLQPIEARNWRSHNLSAVQASDQDRRAVSRHFYVKTGRRRFVDKNNQNGLAVPYLHALFPEAHFVYVKRSPGDNINSLIEGWQRPNEFAHWSERLPKQVRVEDGRYTRWCFFLPEGWEDYLDAPVESVCALQYRAMNEAILEAGQAIPAKQWTEIFYEDVLADPVDTFRKVFNALEVPFDRHLHEHCSSVLSRPYNAFSEIRKDKWRDSRHAERITLVLPDIANVAERMGY